MTKFIIIALEAITIIALSMLWKKVHTQNAKSRHMAIRAEDKMREEALDRIILNESAFLRESKEFSAKPFEVSYDAMQVEKTSVKSVRKKNKDVSKIMVQLIENTELSTKKYMFDPAKGIRIGSKKGKNSILIADSNVDNVQCEILSNQDKVYVRNVGGSGKVILARGRHKAYVEKKVIELKTGDSILIGSTFFKIDLIKANV